jgi:hypothetical protein
VAPRRPAESRTVMAKPTTKPKKADVRLDILTVTGNSGKTNIFYRHPT